MNSLLLKALIALVPSCILLFGSILLSLKGRTFASFLQLLGTTGLIVVVLTHVAEALNLLPSMGWGLEHSAGHYLDLLSAALAFTSFPFGYLLHALEKQPSQVRPSATRPQTA